MPDPKESRPESPFFPQSHGRSAEWYLTETEGDHLDDIPATLLVAQAQVHALLAVAEAVSNVALMLEERLGR